MIKIKFRHEYDYLFSPLDVNGVYKRHWGTSCRIYDDGVELAEGLAYLSPKDQFSKPVGRAVSFYRALKNIPSRDMRKRVAASVDKETLILGRELVG